MPEGNNNSGGGEAAPQTNAPKPAGAKTGVVEGGDLTGHVDFYTQTDNSPAVVDNDPNVIFDDEGGGGEGDEAGAEDGDEGAAAEEAGELGEGEEGEGEGTGDENGEGGEGKDDGEGQAKAPKSDKTTSVSFGGKDYDLPLDATVPVTVNGETEEATVQQLRDAYSAKSSIRKDLETAKEAKSELSTHRRKMMRDFEKKEVGLIEKEFTLTQGRKLAKEGQLEAALNEFFEFDADIWDRFDDLMSGYYPKFAGLSAEQRRVIQLDRRNKLSEQKTSRATEATAMQAEIDKFNNYKEQSCKNSGLEETDVEDAWDAIVERANSGKYNDGQLKWLKEATPYQKWDASLSEAVAGKTRGKITDVVKAQFPKLENQIAKIIEGLEETRSGKFLIKASKEDIAKIIQRDYNDGKPGKTGEKVGTTNSLRDKAQPRHKLGEAPTQEDDDDDLYAQDGHSEPSNQVWGGQFTNR